MIKTSFRTIVINMIHCSLIGLLIISKREHIVLWTFLKTHMMKVRMLNLGNNLFKVIDILQNTLCNNFLSLTDLVQRKFYFPGVKHFSRTHEIMASLLQYSWFGTEVILCSRTHIKWWYWRCSTPYLMQMSFCVLDDRNFSEQIK